MRATMNVRRPTHGIVADVQPIIHVANTAIYTRVLTETMGVPFSISKGLGCVEITKSQNENIEDGSKVVSINGRPVRSLEYSDVKNILTHAEWPISVELERPPKREYLPDLMKYASFLHYSY